MAKSSFSGTHIVLRIITAVLTSLCALFLLVVPIASVLTQNFENGEWQIKHLVDASSYTNIFNAVSTGSMIVVPLVIALVFYIFSAACAFNNKLARFITPVWLVGFISSIVMYILTYNEKFNIERITKVTGVITDGYRAEIDLNALYWISLPIAIAALTFCIITTFVIHPVKKKDV